MPKSAPPNGTIVCELADLAARMVAATYRRNHPDANDAEVEQAVRAWWQDRPGAPHGDAVGIVRPVPEEWRRGRP